MNPSNTLRGSLGLLMVIGTALVIGCAMQVNPISTTLSLTGGQEVPPVTTTATGAGQINVHSDRSVSGSISVFGMTPTAAHIHDGAMGVNGPVVITLTKASENTFTVPAGSMLNEAQYSSLRAGNFYVNVHSAAYPNGEIRAQIKSPPG